MLSMAKSLETVERLYELVCRGNSIQASAEGDGRVADEGVVLLA